MPLNTNIAVGLDIGQASTKLVILRRAKNQVKVVKTAIFRNWEEGIVSPEEVAEHLGQWVREQDVGSREIVLGVPQYLAICQLSDFPPAKSQQLEEMVRLETQQLAGLSDEAFLHDYRQLTPFDHYQNPVLIGVCKESAIWDRLEPLLEYQLNISDLGMDGQALVSAWEQAVPAAERAKGLQMILDIGVENATLVLTKDGQSVYVGSCLSGGQVFTNALMRHLNLPEAEAERAKRDTRIIRGHLDSPMTQAAISFSRELHSALENWRLQGNEGPLDADGPRNNAADLQLDAIHLSGGGSLIQGLDEYLGDLFECPVKPLRTGCTDTPADDGQLAVAYGLALQGLAPPDTRISLAPRQVTWLAQRKRRAPWLVAAVGLLALSAILYVLSSAIMARNETARLQERAEQLAQAHTLIKELKSTAGNVDLMQNMLLPFVAKGNRNATMITAIDLISKYQQKDDWLILLADENSYFARPEMPLRGQTPDGKARSGSIFGAPATTDATPVGRSLYLPADIRTWRYLVASGFTPAKTEDPWGNLRKTVNALNNEPDSIFKGVDTLPESSRSPEDFRLVRQWREKYENVRSFAVLLPLKHVEFAPREKQK